MKSLDSGEQRHVLAARGWIELGLTADAFDELDSIAPECRAHPDVLEVRWNACFMAKNWAQATDVAFKLTRMAPDRFSGWWQLSFALHEMGLTQEAFDSLVSVRHRFSGEWMTHYHLARYLVQLGRVKEGRAALRRALEIEPKQRLAALEEPDLEPLRMEMQRKR